VRHPALWWLRHRRTTASPPRHLNDAQREPTTACAYDAPPASCHARPRRCRIASGVTRQRTPRRPTPALPSSGASRPRRRLPCSARQARPPAASLCRTSSRRPLRRLSAHSGTRGQLLVSTAAGRERVFDREGDGAESSGIPSASHHICSLIRCVSRSTDFTVTELEDRLAIIELIGRLSLAIDAKDWDAMAQLFTDPVYHDRTSLSGGEPYTAPVAQFVEGWRQTLQAMDAVHHQITNHVVSVDGDEATCMANHAGHAPACQRVGVAPCGRSAIGTSTSSSGLRTAGESPD
jgi:SnoaL-like domain